ncbi:MAG: radical SAM protein [Chloroflexi bacterium]|nr:radical SAM protein [Chloroflexota bacterium]
MDALEKLNLLGEAAQFDLCTTTGRPMPNGLDISKHIVPVATPAGSVPMLRILQTSACAKNCFYCPFRRGRDFRRAAYQPEELARTTEQLYRARLIKGLFLSSGVVGKGDYSQEKIIATAEILRQKLDFKGYLHLKLMPGASQAAVESTVRLADRVSINLEAPNSARLARLAPEKDLHAELWSRLQMAYQARSQQDWGSQQGWATATRPVSQVTQFVVGAAGETDKEILTTSEKLYKELHLARIYYSVFRPIPDTPLENLAPEDPQREHRLYQVDFLLRQYQFTLEDIPLDEDGNLPRGEDPKLAYAQRHPELFPVEVNRATRRELLRIPGIGPATADRILDWRRHARLQEISDLRKAGADVKRAAPYVLLAGRLPAVQLTLW